MLRDVAHASPLQLRRTALFQRGRLGYAAAASARRPPRPHCWSRSPVEAAVGKRRTVSIFGTDYPTPDGTGIRDYIHVEDLAAAHLDALEYLRKGGASTVLNVGYGHGYSVRQVLESVERVAGKRSTCGRSRAGAGDPPALVARADRIRAELGWQPRLDDLDTIVRTALGWEQRLLREPW